MKNPPSFFSVRSALVLGCGLVLTLSKGMAASYASGISITGGTTVNFTLNEAADSLFYSINGGAPQSLDGSTSGVKSFALTSPTDTFSITASKTAAVGYTIPTGATTAVAASGLGASTPTAGYNLISSGVLTNFNSPRGVAVANNPNNPNFGTAYIANSAAGTAAGRAVGDGLYAIKADQSDAFGYANTAQTGGITQWASSPSGSSPYRVTVGSDYNLYIADFADATGTVWRTSGSLTGGTAVLSGIGGPSSVPVGQFHGSTTAVYVEGSAVNGTLSVYTLDEDLTSANVGGVSTTDKNSLWAYNIGAGATPSSVSPTKVNTSNNLVPAANSDLDRGANGLWYVSQNRAGGAEAGVFVLNATGDTIFSSLTASASLGSAVDILRNVQGMAVSPDQKYLAIILNNSDVAIVPLDENGIPRIQDRLVVDTGADINSGRDIAFDAAGNIHYVSSGQAAYRVIAPGGYTSATISYNGTSYSFVVVPEPSSVASLALAAGFLARRRRKTLPA